MSDLTPAQIFDELFRGNKKAYGVHSVKGNHTVKKPYTLEDIKEHLNGVKSLGLIPITEDSQCYFGAIDIDDYPEDSESAMAAIDSKIEFYDLPLIVCKSKSKGFHLYMFFGQPTPAKIVRTLLQSFANQLGYPKSEIFPKQSTLDSDQIGSWINLPYFNAKNTNRYATEFGVEISLEDFLENACAKSLTEFDINQITSEYSKLPEAIRDKPLSIANPVQKTIEETPFQHTAFNLKHIPPCIKAMMDTKVTEGSRNDVLYHVAVFAKKAFPSDYREWCFDFNTKHIEPPLSHDEAKRTITSAGRRDYKYKCNSEPMKTHCNAMQCVTMEYGITAEDKELKDVEEVFEMTKITKINTVPPKYEMYINGKYFNCSGDIFFSFKRFSFQVLDYLLEIVPNSLQPNWQLKMKKRLEQGTIIEAPEDSNLEGIIRERFRQYMQNAWITFEEKGLQEREELIHGQPIIGEKNGILYVFFIGKNFVDRLRSDQITNKPGDVFSALRRMACVPMKLSVNGSSLNIWSIAVKENQLDSTPKYTPIELKEEI